MTDCYPISNNDFTEKKGKMPDISGRATVLVVEIKVCPECSCYSNATRLINSRFGEAAQKYRRWTPLATLSADQTLVCHAANGRFKLVMGPEAKRQ